MSVRDYEAEKNKAVAELFGLLVEILRQAKPLITKAIDEAIQKERR